MAPVQEAAARPTSIEEYLALAEEQDLVRLATAGSVDDGKSTLIGRLLYDAKGMFEDQLAAIRASKVNRAGGPLDFSLLTDGLRAEREQGITIDVAYRHFSTPRRKFIIADTPGHEQYTRNMATGASTADVAVILLDARNGVLPQSRRHAYIANLLGIPQLAVAVNKMDLVGWSREVFAGLREEFTAYLQRIDAPVATFIPLSALHGDNVASASGACPWYQGPTLMEYLETVPAAIGLRQREFRFPVQWVNRPDLSFRGFAGQIASGEVRRGDLVMALPSGKTSRVGRIVTYDGDLATAHAPMSVTLCLEDELDISRGDMLAHPASLPHVSRQFEAEVVWMAAEPLRRDAPYLLKHTTQQTKAKVVRVVHRIDVNSLSREDSGELGLNEIGTVVLETSSPLFFDSYRRNRSTGAFILIDPVTNGTAGAGMILERRHPEAAASIAKTALQDLDTGAVKVTPAERIARLGHQPATIWLTARIDLAQLLERKLFDRGCLAQVLADRVESGILPELAEVLHRAGAIVICSAGAEMDEERGRAKEYVGENRFLEFAPESLAAGDEEAADRVIRALEGRAIIRPAAEFGSGEGI
jgi:sulfate adenylyltransferase large subunit